MEIASFFKKRIEVKSSERGFTLIELVVVITIFAIMSTVLLFNFQGLNKNIEINNLAQDIALFIRKAQTYGVSSSTLGAALDDTNTTSSRYGVYFVYNATTQSVTSMKLYKKLSGVGGTLLADFNDPLNPPLVIDDVAINSQSAKIIVCQANSQNVCTSPITPITDAAVEFERPKPDPYFSLPNGNSSFLVRIESANSSVPWYIVITPTGNIYVKR
jgi:prepilin-type N-terminal cleavage/methylation domain-containing protein